MMPREKGITIFNLDMNASDVTYVQSLERISEVRINCDRRKKNMFDQIPVHVLEQYEGKWIVWDQDDKKVVGSGLTLNEAEDQAEAVNTGHLLRIHHVLASNFEIAGIL